ncbi:MAG: protein adenylyltransferase SelO family protein, partial [Pseudomonadota bacterium]|nr:protein adenylyltransferase SelO family protein [Pseudomonadota bacterium]
DEGLLKSLLDYTIKRHCPEVFDSSNKAVGLIENMIQKQSDLIVHWMRVGFIHGVMNTDNMTLSGETIDYGPCAFMDNYDPNTFFSSIDRGGRYSFMNQPLIAQWNLARLIEALLPLIDNNADNAVKLGEKLIDKFSDIYKQKWLTMMRSKIGLFGDQPEDQILIKDLLDWMHNNDADFTNTFRDLSDGKKPTEIIYETSSFQTWYKQWKKRLLKNSKSWDTSVAMMRNINPIIIPRNHQVERVISAAAHGDFKHFRDFLEVLKEPFKADGKSKPYQIPPEPRERVYQTFCGT